MKTRVAISILSLCGLALVASGQQPAQTEKPVAAGEPLPKCMVAGQVVKAATSEPLKKARVVLRKEEGRETPRVELVDTNGRFQFKDVEPGRYRLYAVRNGYVRQEFGQPNPNHPGTALALSPGQQVKDVVFKLVSAAVIAGPSTTKTGKRCRGRGCRRSSSGTCRASGRWFPCGLQPPTIAASSGSSDCRRDATT